MSKVLSIIGVAFIVSIIAYLVMSKTEDSKTGTISDIQKNIEGLLSSADEMAFLVITVANTNQFVQFSASDNIAQLDFPMVEEEQQSRKQEILNLCKSLGLELTINTGTDGSEFLDYDLKGSPEEISSLVVQIITKLFNVTPTTELKFQSNGF